MSIRYTSTDVLLRCKRAQDFGVPIKVVYIERPGGSPKVYTLWVDGQVVPIAGSRAAYDYVDAWAKGYLSARSHVLRDVIDDTGQASLTTAQDYLVPVAMVARACGVEAVLSS